MKKVYIELCEDQSFIIQMLRTIHTPSIFLELKRPLDLRMHPGEQRKKFAIESSMDLEML